MAAVQSLGAASIKLENNREISLGEELPVIAARLEETAFDVERGRPRIDRMIATVEALLYFDTGRLWRVTLKSNHQMFHPPRPFAEEWKNLGGIGDHRLDPKISREKFELYLKAWRARAEKAGKREGVDFRIQTKSSVLPPGTVEILMAPMRRLMGTGRMTGDRWSLTFHSKDDARINPLLTAGALESVTFEADEFNTLRRETNFDRTFRPKSRLNGRPLAAVEVVGTEVALTGGKKVHFGETLHEAERSMGRESIDNPLPTARPGIDRWIETAGEILEFDSGRLKGIHFKTGSVWEGPIQCFDEDWKNPDPIDDQLIRLGQNQADYLSYLKVWRKRAMLAGKREGIDFWVIEPDHSSGVFVSSVSFAPKRVTMDGASFWSDGWTATFGNDAGIAENRLNLFGVSVDAYSTQDRPPPDRPDPAWAGLRLDDGSEVFFGQRRDEVERMLGGAALIRSTGVRLTTVGNDRYGMVLPPVGLEFDGDRLFGMYLRPPFESVAPFPEAWKNFTTIGWLRVESGMTREDFGDYFRGWESRAHDLGLKPNLAYGLVVRRSEQEETHRIWMRSPRLGPGGGAWRDMWTLTFFASGPVTDRRWTLAAISATRGEFDSRPPPKPTRSLPKEPAKLSEPPQIKPPEIEFSRPEIVFPF